jgi:hypothetical protein
VPAYRVVTTSNVGNCFYTRKSVPFASISSYIYDNTGTYRKLFSMGEVLAKVLTL